MKTLIASVNLLQKYGYVTLERIKTSSFLSRSKSNQPYMHAKLVAKLKKTADFKKLFDEF